MEECDGYVVLTVDPQTGEVDAYGPYDDGMAAFVKADSLRHDFDQGDLGDVHIYVTRLHDEKANLIVGSH